MKKAKMSICFLDIDGVMNCAEWALANGEEDKTQGLIPFTPAAFEVLYELFREGLYDTLVLSSTWRFSNSAIMRVQKELHKHGLNMHAILPVIYRDKREDLKCYIFGNENFIENYFILDDDDLGIPNQIRIDNNKGLTKEDIPRIREILKPKI